MRIIVNDSPESSPDSDMDTEVISVRSVTKQDFESPDRVSFRTTERQKKKESSNYNSTNIGCNSSDEMERGTHSPGEEMELFEKEIKSKKGLTIKQMAADGNCLFRSVSEQIYGDPEMHDHVRARCMDYIEAERDHFSQFITEDFAEYVNRKRKDRTFGNNTELQAIGELFNRPIEIYEYHPTTGLTLRQLCQEHYQTNDTPLRLSYHNGNHYNAIIDPHHPTVGLGLGLPEFEPGVLSTLHVDLQLADRKQVEHAMEQSEISAMEKEIMEQSRMDSEREQTEREIEEIILQQSIEDEIEQAVIAESMKGFKWT